MSEYAAVNDAAGTIAKDVGTDPKDRAGKSRRGLVTHSAGRLSDGALSGVLRSSQNAVASLGPEVPVEAIIQGPGVALLVKGSGSAEVISTAVASGVRVLACGNSLRSAGVPTDGLLPGVEVVPAAIVHLAERQWDGWAYVRL